ncbi:MAG: amidohydrolase family protein [Pseudomonadota bacterium]
MPDSSPDPSGNAQDILIQGAYVLTMDTDLGDLRRGDVHVRGDSIVAVGADLTAVAGARIIDARDKVVLPGFVDTHWHLWNSTLRALVRGDDAQRGYFPITLKVGPAFSPQDSYDAVRLGLAEGLRSGITTVQNWAHNVRSPAHADAELKAMDESGLRGRFAYGWGQELPLDQLMDLKDLARVQRQGLPGDGRLQLGAALRTPVANPRGAVPIEVVAQEFSGVRALGLPMTMHARPGIVTLLQAHGLLGSDLQLVHPQGISPDERAHMARTGTTMSCSPTIEMLYAQATRGEIQFQELQEAGVHQSLSVDSSGASANADFFACMRALLWSHKQRFGARVPLTARRLLQLATIDGARDLGLAHLIGTITPGKRADLQIIRMNDLNIAPVFDPVHALVYSGQPSNVDTVMVDGQILLQGGKPTRWDADALVREACLSLQALASRTGLA